MLGIKKERINYGLYEWRNPTEIVWYVWLSDSWGHPIKEACSKFTSEKEALDYAREIRNKYHLPLVKARVGGFDCFSDDMIPHAILLYLSRDYAYTYYPEHRLASGASICLSEEYIDEYLG